MILPGSYGLLFGCIAAMHVGWDQLEVHVLLIVELFQHRFDASLSSQCVCG
jgi:hypothetical protein